MQYTLQPPPGAASDTIGVENADTSSGKRDAPHLHVLMCCMLVGTSVFVWIGSVALSKQFWVERVESSSKPRQHFTLMGDPNSAVLLRIFIVGPVGRIGPGQNARPVGGPQRIDTTSRRHDRRGRLAKGFDADGVPVRVPSTDRLRRQSVAGILLHNHGQTHRVGRGVDGWRETGCTHVLHYTALVHFAHHAHLSI